MENLSGRKDCDKTITRELQRCGIDIRTAEAHQSEVPYAIEGFLGEFTFKRAWYYYVVHGPMPIEMAKKLYADSVGKTDIRVSGHCGCPAPEGDHISWILPNGRHVVSMRSKTELEKYAVSTTPYVSGIGKKFLNEYEFSDDPESIGAKGYIVTYHVDSEIGLRVFADAVKELMKHE